jgi:hypothetical protein
MDYYCNQRANKSRNKGMKMEEGNFTVFISFILQELFAYSASHFNSETAFAV